MKVVVTVATINPRHGGPARTVPALCRALVRNGTEVELVTLAERRSDAPSIAATEFKATVIETDATRYQSRSWSVRFKKALMSALHANDAILYDVGLWLPANHFASTIARRTQTPFVASPRGMLSSHALEVAKWKKRVAWHLYQQSDLKRARVLHATSGHEAHDFHKNKLTQPIAIIPNGVDVPVRLPKHEASNRRTALFLSRLHPIKGLKDLVLAWDQVRPPGWRVVIAGPDEDGHRGEIESLIATLGLHADFEFAGSVDDEVKWKMFSSAELFVLPSYSESFGLSIAEAMAAGLPVITTCATPWEELHANRCGWWIEPGADSLANTLSLATKRSSAELREMGQRGCDLVRRNYSWDTTAKKMLAVFEWLIGQNEQPNWLV